MKKIEKKRLQPQSTAGESINSTLDNQNGSVIVVVLMVLVTMTVISVASTDSVITENFIIRNVGIHKQNASLVDAALMRGLQEFMQQNTANPDLFDPALNLWINDRNNNTAGDPEFLINTIWYENNFTQRCLDNFNSLDANISLVTGLPEALEPLADRGEQANLTGNLRYAVVGWNAVPGMPVTTGSNQPAWRQGRILAEYLSVDAGDNDNGFGLVRQEMGIRQQW